MSVTLTKLDDYNVRADGLAAEPIVITAASCQNVLDRLFARKSSYAPEQYASKRQPYLDAGKICGWAIVDPEPKAVEPAVDLTDLQKCARNELDEETRREILTTGIITQVMSRVEPKVNQVPEPIREQPSTILGSLRRDVLKEIDQVQFGKMMDSIRVEPTVIRDPAPAEEPPEQVSQMLDEAFRESRGSQFLTDACLDDHFPLPKRVEPPIQPEPSPEAKSWLDRMMAETPDEAEINALANSVDLSGLS